MGVLLGDTITGELLHTSFMYIFVKIRDNACLLRGKHVTLLVFIGVVIIILEGSRAHWQKK